MSIIKIKRSEATLVPDSLQDGELAYSYASGGLFIGSADSSSAIRINAEAPVTSVNSKVGDVTLTYVDVGAAALHHVHVAADIADFKEAVTALIPEDKVTSVNNKAGDVELTYEDVGAAAKKHQHTSSEITDFVPSVDALINAKTLELTLAGLSDVDVPLPKDKQVLSYNTVAGKWVPAEPVVAFTGLTDTPNSYENKAGFLVAVNTAGDGLEFKDSIDGGNY